MNKEKQLEQVAEKALHLTKMNLAPPIFELYVALIAISIACLFFLLPGVLNPDNGFDGLLLATMPQGGWGMAFVFGGLLSATGILLDSKRIRIIALLVLAALYGTVTVFYIMMFPNFGTVLIGWMTIFTIASIPLVRFTSIKHYK